MAQKIGTVTLKLEFNLNDEEEKKMYDELYSLPYSRRCSRAVDVLRQNYVKVVTPNYYEKRLFDIIENCSLRTTPFQMDYTLRPDGINNLPIIPIPPKGKQDFKPVEIKIPSQEPQNSDGDSKAYLKEIYKQNTEQFK